ncbi:MAG: hypothetical protein F9K19_03985 [Rhizobiaceae bacterium]|nr:MAG: hypothetical protein F9K19_03985 [Rhizobiaceae bacterium]CAG0954807.1 hypothetical protein RHIZO_00386 [Rhizobiaceae bacterium]
MIWTRTPSVAGALACAAIVALAPHAGADTRVRDRVYADSFGNLVIHSAAGYKRIVVGEGHLAKELGAYTGSDEPAVVEYQPVRVIVRDCPAVLLKGRSYMYGLPDRVVPQPALDHCD